MSLKLRDVWTEVINLLGYLKSGKSMRVCDADKEKRHEK